MSGMDLQALCECGQQQLMQTLYLEASQTLEAAERQAWAIHDFDTLSRLYLPLQEARRQIRQRCGEGAVRLHLLANGAGDRIAAEEVLNDDPQGQYLIGGWGTLYPAAGVRRLTIERHLYLETFLAAAYPVFDEAPIVVIAPTEESNLPAAAPRSIDELRSLLPPHCVMLRQSDIPSDAAVGNSTTFAGVMALWEQLHTPFLQTALTVSDPVARMQAYRTAIHVDRACELAHQFLADIARTLSRQR